GLTDVVRESVTSFQAVVSQKGRKLESEIADGIFVMGDRNLLMELSNILIDNAVKYCDDDGTIHVALRKKGKAGAVLSVANDYQKGAGLDCSRFFRRFYRGDSSHNSGMEGHGIGLSMAKSITEKMGGSIGAAWKDGIITFTVIL
ncbi:MAG TPA: sensor histidine kinase, partial [Lachnospiraceae bacterium]|nr:sensor histidine kinase [Lachnospiraceae bacterium]